MSSLVPSHDHRDFRCRKAVPYPPRIRNVSGHHVTVQQHPPRSAHHYLRNQTALKRNYPTSAKSPSNSVQSPIASLFPFGPPASTALAVSQFPNFSFPLPYRIARSPPSRCAAKKVPCTLARVLPSPAALLVSSQRPIDGGAARTRIITLAILFLILGGFPWALSPPPISNTRLHLFWGSSLNAGIEPA